MIDTLELTAIPAEDEALRADIREFPGRRHGRPARRPAGAFLDGLRRRLQPRPGRARLAGHDAAARIRRRRARAFRALRVVGRTAVRRRAGLGALDRRPPERAADPEIRHRGAAPLLPASHLPRRGFFLHRHERTELGLRSGQHPHPRRAARRRLAAQRQQDLDHQCASLALHDRAGAHLGHGGRPAPGPVADDRRPVPARRNHPAHRRPGRRRALLGSVLRQRRARRAGPDRQRGRRLAAGQRRTGVRAQRP